MFPFLNRRLLIQMAIAAMFGTTKREGDLERCESCNGAGRLYYEGGRYSVVCGPCMGQGEVKLKRCSECRKLVQVFAIGKVCRNCDVVIPAG